MPDPAEQSLLQRMLSKAMSLLDREPNRLAKGAQYASPSEWSTQTPWGSVPEDPRATDVSKPLPADHPFVSGPMKGKQRWQRNLSRSLEGKSVEELRGMSEDIEDAELWDEHRKYENIAENMRRMGISDTVTDVTPQPMNAVTQGRWDTFLETSGLSPKEASAKIYKMTSKPGYPGGPVAITTGYKGIEKEDLDPRDPFRSGDAFQTPYAKSPKNPATQALIKQSLGLPRKPQKQQ